MRTTSKTALAYMAGLIDGEGSICVTRRSDSGASHHSCRLSIVNCDKRMIDWVQDHFGANVYGVSRVDKSRRDKHRVLYVFEARSDNAADILRAVLPYLVVKREQAELFLQIRQTYTGGLNGGVPAHVIAARQDIVDRMRALNRRGP